MGLIYKYTNKINNKSYIGQTLYSLEDRWARHKSSAYNPNACDYDSAFHRAIRKYGEQNFKCTVLASEIDNSELLNELECYYIKRYDSYNNGYNCTTGGGSGYKIKPWSSEAKNKLALQRGELTEKEVEELRIAYNKKESPSKIYQEKYVDRLTYSAFLNIWSGRRYKEILPDLIKKGRHTKLTKEIVQQIRKDRETTNLSYEKLAEKYKISKSTIADIIKFRTWKNA